MTTKKSAKTEAPVNPKIVAVQKRRATAAKKSGVKPPTAAAELKAMGHTGKGAKVKLNRPTVSNPHSDKLRLADVKTVHAAIKLSIKNQPTSKRGSGRTAADKAFDRGEPSPTNLAPMMSWSEKGSKEKLGIVDVPKPSKSEQMKAIAKTAKANRDAAKVATAAGAPMTPLTKLFINSGYVFAQSRLLDDEVSTAHGYTHPDGSAAMFIHANISTEVAARWIVKRADGTQVEGKTAKQLAVALVKPVALPENVVAAITLLSKLTKGTFRLFDLATDANYTARVQLLKVLLKTDKILVKVSETRNLVKEFHKALNVDTPAEFEVSCATVLKTERKADNAVRKVEKEEIKEVLKVTGKKVAIHDDKPVLPGVKKLSAKKQAEADEKMKLELQAQIARKRRQEEYTPIAVPRPDATIHMDIDSICLLEDPNNGIVLMCLEKPNSQGAICVYNNGSRVAVGVVPTEVLMTLRPLISKDLISDVNQLLHPITAGVLVTPQAEQQLTAVLDYCKENMIMATDTAVVSKKFAPPAGVAKKTASKAVKGTKAEKSAKAPKAAKEAKTPRVVEDKKIKSLVTLKSEGLPREGSFCFGQVEAIIGSKTLSEAQAKLDKSALNPSGRKLEVAWLVKKGYLQVAA